jgi:hypothetical protein
MLSAILITRNEAHNLEDCLASLQGFVDEIVVVDTQKQRFDCFNSPKIWRHNFTA